MRALATAVFVSAFVLPVVAQQPLVETIEVRVANIDVVVRDRAGNPVPGLTKSDFELFDDKLPQTITNFYEVRRGEETGDVAAGEPEVPLEVRQRRVVVFIDSGSLTPARKKSALDSVRRFVDNIRPEDRVMLVSWRMGVHLVTPFTRDKEALNRGLETISRLGPAGEASPASVSLVRHRIQQIVDMAESEQGQQRPMISWDAAYAEARSMVERYAHELEAQEHSLLDAIAEVATTMAGLDGKKVLVFVGENVPEHPGADLNRYVNDVIGPHLDRNNIHEVDTLLGVVGTSVPNAIDQLGRQVSAQGVAIYAIGAATTEGDGSAENDSLTDTGYAFTRDANTSSTLDSMARATGGVAITRTSNFDLAFDTIRRDLSSYYSLGYRPVGEGQRQHRISVRTKNREYVVRARQTFVTKSTDDQMEDRTIANLYVDPARSDWPITIRTGSPKADGGKFLVPVQVIMPATITFIPQNEDLVGAFTVYIVLGKADGATSSVLRRPENLKIPKTAEAMVRAKPMTFTTALRVNPGESTLSIAIIDQLSGAMGFARTTIVARR